MAQKFTSLYKDDPIAEELAAGIQATDVYQGSPYALANVPQFEGVRYATPDYNRYQDLYNLYLGGGFDAAQPDFVTPPADTTPVAIGGEGGGNTVDQLGTVNQGGIGVNTPFEQNLIDQGVGVQAEPGAPISAPGEGMLTQQAIDDLADYPVTPANLQDPTTMLPQIPEVVAQDPTTMIPQLGSETPSYIGGDIPLEDTGAGIDDMYATDYQGEEYIEPQSMLASEMIEAQKASMPKGKAALGTIDRTPASQILDDEYYEFDTVDQQTLDAPYGVNPNTGIPYQEPRTIADQKAVLGVVTEEDAANPKGLLEKIGLGNLDVKKTAVMAAINKAVGAPVSLLISALEALPQSEPTFEERTFEEELGVTEQGKFLGSPSTSAFAGLNAVSMFGDPVKTAKDRIDTRLETIENNPDISEEFKENTQKMIDEWEEVTDKLGDIDDDPTGDAEIATETIGTLPEITEARQEQGEYIQEIETQPAVDTTTQSGRDEADRQQRDTGVATVQTNQGTRYETSSGDRYASAAEAAEKGDGGGGSSGGKIVCTMMNDSYGFGSFRNKIWLKHSKDLAPEYQIGYHKIFLPLVRLSKTNKLLKKTLELIAVHRTIDIRQEARGKVHLLGRVYRKILEPICYWVGKYAKR